MLAYLLSLLRRSIASLDIIAITAAIVVSLFVVWPGWLRQAREDGAAEERSKWVEAKEKAEAERDMAVASAQRKIDEAETGLVTAKAENDIRMNELAAALAAEREDNARVATIDGSAAAKPAGICPSANQSRAMPERVRNALNALGGH